MDYIRLDDKDLSDKINYRMNRFGQIILFGSGETADSGKRILRLFLRQFPQKQKVVILETPAGFQPNSRQVAQDIADTFKKSLSEFVENIAIIAARHKDDPIYNPNNLEILKPLSDADFIFIGPGSPTYAVKHLKDSKAWEIIVSRWKNGSTLCFSSAGALAVSKYTLPVYEIFKAGVDLHWIEGLNILKEFDKSISFITHWNNKEGGTKLDTRFCYMGEERLTKLLKMIPKETTTIGIDEHTAIIFDFTQKIIYIDGSGNAILKRGAKSILFSRGNSYKLNLVINHLFL